MSLTPGKVITAGRWRPLCFKQVAEQVANYLKIRPDREETMSDTMARRGANRLRTAAVGEP
jgi:hypothetical protein